MPRFSFHSDDLPFVMKSKLLTSKWLSSVCLSEGRLVGGVNYIFTSDEQLLSMNRQHLGHDYFTDVITFDLSESPDTAEGDIYISIDRVSENAQLQSVSFYAELHRILVHGLLHLCGHTDTSETDRQVMTHLENKYLEARPLKLSEL